MVVVVEGDGDGGLLKLRKLIGLDRYDRGIQLLEGVVSMLTKML